MRYHRSLIAGAVGLAAAGMLGAAPAQAEHATFGLYAPTALVLSLSYGENPQTVQRAVTLRCEPAGGDHPDVDTACAELASVRGNFSWLSGEDGVCTKEYRPVTVAATGVYRGHATEYSRVFPNHCMMVRAKGPVFDF